MILPHLFYEAKASSEAILQLFDERKESASDNDLNTLYTMRRGKHVLTSVSGKINIRNAGFNHLYHHGGQLSVYLRLLDVNVSGMCTFC